MTVRGFHVGLDFSAADGGFDPAECLWVGGGWGISGDTWVTGRAPLRTVACCLA